MIMRMKELDLVLLNLVNLAYLVQICKAGSKNPLDFSLRNHKLLFPQPVYYPSSFNLFFLATREVQLSFGWNSPVPRLIRELFQSQCIEAA